MNEVSDMFKHLRIFDDDLDEEELKLPNYCLLSCKPFDNVKKIDLFNNDDILNCITHLQKHHPDNFFLDFAQYKVDLTQPGEYHSVLRQMNYLYFLEFEVKNNIVYVTVHMLNKPNSYNDLKRFTVEFKQERSLISDKAVRHKGMGYIYTLKFKVSDLSIIGDVSETEVYINVDQFSWCTCEITNTSMYLDDEMSYSYRSGWRCLECAKGEKWCSTGDPYDMQCEWKEIQEKLLKHTYFFCPYQATCFICHGNMYETSPALHYQKHHQDITHAVGEEFRIQPTAGRYCLLRCSDGTVLVVRYHLDNEELQVVIRSPWHRRDLAGYTCITTVSTHNQTQTFPLYPIPVEFDDWKLRVGKWIFKKWDTEFQVCVNLQRKISDRLSDDSS